MYKVPLWESLQRYDSIIHFMSWFRISLLSEGNERFSQKNSEINILSFGSIFFGNLLVVIKSGNIFQNSIKHISQKEEKEHTMTSNMIFIDTI